MIDDTTNLDQTDEEILAYTVSDDALEAAAGPERGAQLTCEWNGGCSCKSPGCGPGW